MKTRFKKESLIRFTVKFRTPIFLLIIVLFLLAGHYYFKNTFPWGDSLNVFSPLPSVDCTVSYTKISHNFFSYVLDWYNGQNGRLSQAVVNAAISSFSKIFISKPENFPSWLFKIGSLACIILIPFLFFYWLNRKAPFSKSYYGWIAASAVSILWFCNSKIFPYPLWFDVCFTMYFLPVIFLLLFMIYLDGKFLNKKSELLVFIALFVFISLNTEHFLLTVPIFTSLVLLLESEKYKASGFTKRFSIIVICFIICYLIYQLSPGQKWRLGAIGFSFPELTWHNLLGRYKYAIPRGYQAIFPPLFGSGELVFYSIFHSLLLLFSAAYIIYSSIYKKKSIIDPKFRRVLIFFFMLAAYTACFITLFVSGYFPEATLSYPVFLLLISLATGALILFERIRCPASVKIIFIVIFSLFLIVKKVIPEYRSISASYNELVRHDTIRQEVYKNIIKMCEEKGEKVFLLKGFPVNSYGWSLEPPWGLSAYFRWNNLPEIHVYIEENKEKIPEEEKKNIQIIKFNVK